MPHCMWFRQDLRCEDNTALLNCCQTSKDGVIALFVITASTWQRHQYGSNRINFMLQSLQQLKTSLAKLNIPLKIIDADSFNKTPDAILQFCFSHNITELHFNREFLLDEMTRDKAVYDSLNQHDITLHAAHDRCILPPKITTKANGEAFKVFTPFKKDWLQKVTPADYALRSTPKPQAKLALDSDNIPDSLSGFNQPADTSWCQPGETAAHKQLDSFCQSQAANYESTRNDPALEGTSRLSPYLACGSLSARQCIQALLHASSSNDLTDLQGKAGESCWLSELIWREFYSNVAYHFNDVVKHQPFKPYTAALPWSHNQAHFQAWCEGKTGFPIVDAAMRQLNSTGWMHNRLRMVSAMFLTKIMFIDWRWGEDYFMQQLIDADFASNNGGWQWSASTGTDAVPYFRIFNPTTQSERFDKAGRFIRQFCPELKDCSDKEIHNPSNAVRQHCNYPLPVVDYKACREKTLQHFKAFK